MPYNFAIEGHFADIRDNPGTQWLDLDRLLVQFWVSRSIRPKIVYPGNATEIMKDWIVCLLPEITKRGIVDLVKGPDWPP